MISFPNAKINLGLKVLNRRPDGFHTIETVFYPIAWCDALEVLTHGDTSQAFLFSQSGLSIEGNPKENLIYKAWELICAEKKLPPLRVHLHKHIPMGAGLGGGSSDAACFIKMVNTRFDLSYSEKKMMQLASALGSDCAFFIKNRPVFAQEKGDVFTEIDLDLSSYFLLVVYPGLHSNTREAYQGLGLKPHSEHTQIALQHIPVSDWKNSLTNDFEETIFSRYSEIKLLKEQLYAEGALYASLSGSGSSVFGIFKKEPSVKIPDRYSFFLQRPLPKIL